MNWPWQRNATKKVESQGLLVMNELEKGGHPKFEAVIDLEETVLDHGWGPERPAQKEKLTGFYLTEEEATNADSSQLRIFRMPESNTCEVWELSRWWRCDWSNPPSKEEAKRRFNEFALDYEVQENYDNNFNTICESKRGEVHFSDDGTCGRCEGVFSLEHSSLHVFWDNGTDRELIREASVKDWREAMDMFYSVSANRDER